MLDSTLTEFSLEICKSWSLMLFFPPAMVRGWWWIKDPEELYSTLQALHPRGIREKVLHKHLAKHMESLADICNKPVNGECCSHMEPL